MHSTLIAIAFYTTIFLPLIIGIILILSKRLVNLAKTLILLSSIGIIFSCSIYAWVWYALLTGHSNGNFLFFTTILGIFVITAIFTVASALWGWIKKKRVYIPICIIAVACAVTTGGIYAYNRYIDSIPTVGESNGLLREYAPYLEDSKIVVLDEPPELTFDEKLPKMDGATALYPIYSAFAKAVYPPEWGFNSPDGEKNYGTSIWIAQKLRVLMKTS